MELLRSRGHEVLMYSGIPSIAVTLKKSEIEEIASRDDVSAIYLGGKEPVLELDSAVPASRVPAVWNRGLQGTGQKVAIVDWGPVENNSSITVAAWRPGSPPIPFDHATECAGCAASHHPTFKGVAPQAQIISADVRGTTYTEINNDWVSALDWVRTQAPAAVSTSMTQNLDADDDDMHYIDRAYDYFTRYYFLNLTKSAGNWEVYGNHITSPGKAYGVITVGGTDNKETAAWGDDGMYFTDPDHQSTWKNPRRDDGGMGDREKPEVVAPATNITTITPPNTTGTWSGTSYATAEVAGMVALMVQRNSWLRTLPEAVKAIVMASAVHNIDGPTIMRNDGYDDKDGAGAMDAALADAIASHMATAGENCAGPCWWQRSIWANDPPAGSYLRYNFTAKAGERVRVAISWHSNPSSNYSSDPLSTNLNLHVHAPNQSIVAESNTYDNAFEIVDFIAGASGTYSIDVYKYVGNESNYLGIAWTTVPDVNLPVTLRSYSTGSEGQTSTSILAQNLTPRTNNITLSFYQIDGSQTAGTKIYSLPSEASHTFDQRYASGDPGVNPFQGASVLSSEDAAAAVVQMVRSGGTGGVKSYDAYNGLGETAVGQAIKAPLLMRLVSAGGKTWNTTMSIQNTNLTTQAQVTVTYVPDTLGNAHTDNYTIPGGGTQYVRHELESDLGAQFFGSATIASKQQDVGVVVTLGSLDGSLLSAYPTYATVAGASRVDLPGAYKNIPSMGDNYWSSFTIVNMGAGTVTVHIEYQALIGIAYSSYDEVVSTSRTIDLRGDTHISDPFFGAIKLTVVSPGSISAMLNTRGDASSGISKFTTTYSGFPGGPTVGYTPYLLKYIVSEGYNWSTSILIQNLDQGAGPITVNIVYKEDPAYGTHTYTSSKQVATFDYVDLRYDNNITQGTFYGSAKLTCDRPFGAVVLVRGSAGTGDALSSYLGITQ